MTVTEGKPRRAQVVGDIKDLDYDLEKPKIELKQETHMKNIEICHRTTFLKR